MNLISRIFKRFKHTDIQPYTPEFNHVDLFYWAPYNGGLNFGDHLSKIIVSKILAENNHVLEEEVSQARRLFAVGSILHFAKDDDVIWGSGVNGKIDNSEYHFKNLDVRAVRGPLTRSFLQERGIRAPEVYGDPALLLPRLFPGRFKRKNLKKYVIVPNLHDLQIVRERNYENVVSPLNSWNRCVTEILEADFVIASSLHGIIIAEAYGIPARYLRLSETEDLFKYNDYMLGTGREEIEPAASIGHALEMAGMSPPVFDEEKLLNAFPIDLWNKL